MPPNSSSSATFISGRDLSETIRAEIADGVATFRESSGSAPGLAVVLVGDDPASQVYVRMKGRAADAVGLDSRQIDLPADTPNDEVIGVVDGLNADADVHGILVQLPLPDQIDADAVVRRIDPVKDVDGLHPVNVGRLASGDPEAVAPCTPAGIVEMLLRSGHDPEGLHVVIIGRSNLVGRPLASLLLRKTRGGNATVTVAHSRTKDLAAISREADVLVAAVGRPGLVTADMVRPGAVVVDVGVNRVDAPDTERGYRLVGDVEFDDVAEVAGAITPVPGGVGPMTITMLLGNTLAAARRQRATAGRAGAAVQSGAAST